MPGNSWTTYKKKLKRQKSSATTGIWKPLDDFLLIQGVLATNDLETVHLGTKFSTHVTLQDVKDRWSVLLYNDSLSQLAVDAMRANLHPEMIEKAERNALFSPAEELCLHKIVNPFPDLSDFERLLDENFLVFHPARKPADLMHYHQLLKQYQLLPSSNLSDYETFSECEANVDDVKLKYKWIETPEVLKREEILNQRQKIMRIRRLEAEMETWTVTNVKPINGFPYIYPEMDGKTLAILRGRIVKYMLKSTKITFGRNTKDSRVDLNLSLEGLADKVSRHHGTFQLTLDGEFWIENHGKRAIFVDGVPVIRGKCRKVRHLAVIEISDLFFTFLVNQEVVQEIKNAFFE